MRKIVRWIVISLGSLLGILLVAFIGFAVYANFEFKEKRTNAMLLPISADSSPEGIARGEYLVRNVMVCADCHGHEFGKEPLSGRVEYTTMGPISATIAFPNLTSDIETGLGGWSDPEIARAIREGLDKDGIELVLMPSGNYGALSDQDVAAIIGYLRTLEPVRNEIPSLDANIPGKILMISGLMPIPPAGEPLLGSVSSPQPGTKEYGGYLVSLAGCRDCHGEDLAGAPLLNNEPGESNSPNIGSGSYAATWTEAEFVQTFRTGLTPVKRPINPDKMPIKSYANMKEEDIAAIYAYLQSLASDSTK